MPIWFDCIMIVPPKLYFVDVGGYNEISAVEAGKQTGLILRDLLYDDELYIDEDNKEELFEQAFMYWVRKHSKIIKKFEGNDKLNTPASLELAKEILYLERALKLTAEKYVELYNERQREKGSTDRMLTTSLPPIAHNWKPYFGIEKLENFCEELTPSVTNNYVLRCLNMDTNIKAFISEEDEKEIQKAKPMRKSKGGRPPDPEIAERNININTEYYNLTEKEEFKRSKAIKILSEKYGLAKSTIEKYIK